MDRSDLQHGIKRWKRRAFTLIEVLVVTAVIGVLVSLALPAMSGARGVARQCRELAAARQLMTAFTSYADENKGKVLTGYASKAMVNGPLVVRNAEGKPLHGEVAQRYPWRLAPSFDYDFRGLYSEDKLLTAIRNQQAEYSKYGVDFDYIVSLFPSLGINAAFVGGSDKFQEFDPLFRKSFGRVYIDRIDQANRPTQLMVFVSARCELQTLAPGLGAPEGFFRVDPPYFAPGQGRRWECAYDPRSAAPAVNSGYVSLRYKGRAVAAMLDAHAEPLTWDQLGDMRRWSDEADREDWTIKPR